MRSSKKAFTGCTWPAASGPRIIGVAGLPAGARHAHGPDTRAKSMMVAFSYDNGAVGSLYYSREIPSLFKGLRLSKLFGRKGIITFESNGVVHARARRGSAAAACCRASATSAAIRRCIATSSRAIRDRRAPEMSLERAIDDQRLMDQIYADLPHPRHDADSAPPSPEQCEHVRHHHHRQRRGRRHDRAGAGATPARAS